MNTQADTQNDWPVLNTESQEWQTVDNPLFNMPIQYKLAGRADGFVLLLVKLPAGVASPVHTHPTMEFLYVLEGAVRSNGVEMYQGHGFGAPTGSVHHEFVSEQGATVLALVSAGSDSEENSGSE